MARTRNSSCGGRDLNIGSQGKVSLRPARAIMLCSALALAYGTPLWAQYGAQFGAQYVPPGTPATFRDRPSKPAFEENIQEAPWKLGKLRLSPWLGLRDGSLVRAAGDLDRIAEEDLTLTVGAGLRGYLPAGPKAIVAAHALPEYVWWSDHDAKRGLNGRYGLGMFFFFNRMTLEISHRRLQQQGYFSSEIQDLTSSRNDLSTFSFEVEISPNLLLLGDATRSQVRNVEEENVTFSALDRTEEAGRQSMRPQTFGKTVSRARQVIGRIPEVFRMSKSRKR